jgi:hypothetical protein
MFTGECFSFDGEALTVDFLFKVDLFGEGFFAGSLESKEFKGEVEVDSGSGIDDFILI